MDSELRRKLDELKEDWVRVIDRVSAALEALQAKVIEPDGEGGYREVKPQAPEPASSGPPFTKTGWYRCRDGEVREVLTVRDGRYRYPLVDCADPDLYEACTWKSDGRASPGLNSPADLIEYLGPEKPDEPAVEAVPKAKNEWAEEDKSFVDQQCKQQLHAGAMADDARQRVMQPRQSLTPTESARQDEIDKSICLDPTTTAEAVAEFADAYPPPFDKPGRGRSSVTGWPPRDCVSVPPLREWWLNYYPNDSFVVHPSETEADKSATPHRIECIHVREMPSAERIRVALDEFASDWGVINWEAMLGADGDLTDLVVTLLERLLGPLPDELKGGE